MREVEDVARENVKRTVALINRSTRWKRLLSCRYRYPRAGPPAVMEEDSDGE